MAFYTVMIPPPGSGGAREEIEQARLFPETLTWPAFVLTGLWLLYKRLWLASIVFAIVWGALFYAQSQFGLNGLSAALVQTTIGFYLALEGQNLIVRKLARQGWRLADVVEARDLAEAERRYFERALAGETSPARSPISVPQRQPQQGPVPVIGLFPEAQRR